MVELPGPFPGQLVRAFGSFGAHPPEFCVVAESDSESVVLRMLRDGSTHRFEVGDAQRLAALLKRADICQWKGLPFALVSSSCGALIIGSGPAQLPDKLAINAAVTRLEEGRAIEIPADGPDQPTWHAFAIREGAGQGNGA